MSGMERRARLESLFAQHAQAVRAYALRRADPATADDVVSEVFVVACRRLADLPDDALPWLLGCARRVLANQHRAQRRQRALSERRAAAVATEPHGPDSPDGALAAALAGPQGAYLVVLPPKPSHPREGGIGTSASPGSGLTSVRYRDGHVCHIRSPVALGGVKPCPTVGYVAPRHRRVTSAQVAAPRDLPRRR